MSELYQPNLVVVGGGTGSFTLLQELKDLTPNITAVVNMCDDGGSTGMLRDELGVLPPGDVRQCLVALSDIPQARDMFSYRFDKGMLKNHSLGNLIISGLEGLTGSFTDAVEIASQMLNIKGQVVPVSVDEHTLIMRDGEHTIRGEHTISGYEIASKNPTIELDPPAQITDQAQTAFSEADMIVIAPGNLYSSLIPALAVCGVRQAITASRAQKVMVANLINKPGQTDGWHIADYVTAIEQYLGVNQLDFVIYNNVNPDIALLEKYAADGELPVLTGAERLRTIGAQAIGARLVANEVTLQDPNDTILRRTLIRHDAVEVSRLLKELLNNTRS
jgi:uncharacterized cofD-like protein